MCESIWLNVNSRLLRITIYEMSGLETWWNLARLMYYVVSNDVEGTNRLEFCIEFCVIRIMRYIATRIKHTFMSKTFCKCWVVLSGIIHSATKGVISVRSELWSFGDSGSTQSCDSKFWWKESVECYTDTKVQSFPELLQFPRKVEI